MRKLAILSTLVLLASAIEAQSIERLPLAPADPFTRYATPGQCEQAAIRLKRQYWRDKRPDTVGYASTTDSIPAPVLRAVRNCVVRVSSATVPARELLNLGQLYLWANQDNLAQQTIDRLLGIETKHKAVSDRGWTLYLWIRSLLEARPTRVDVTRKYLAQLDTLGPSAATWQLLAHTSLAQYLLSINDCAAALGQARAAVKVAKQMSFNDRLDWFGALLDAYAAMAESLAIQDGGSAALAILDTAATEFVGLRPTAELQSAINGVRVPYTLLGLVGPPVTATMWYGIRGDTMRPQHGKVSLLVFVNASCGAFCYPTYAALRRLYAKYGAAGLDIILMSTTHGYFRNQLIRDVRAESDTAGNYFLNFLKLPAALAMEGTKYTVLPDGRRRDAQMANRQHYFRGGDAVLIDTHGVVRLVATRFGPMREAVWGAVIRTMLLK